MKKILLSLFTVSTLFLTGCLETTQEITLNEDGSGTISNQNDLSQIMALANQMGAGKEMEQASMKKIDSTISFEKGADSITSFTPEEREMARKGTMRINADMEEGVFLTKMTFPFSSPDQIPAYNKMSGKIMADVLKERAGENMPAGEMPEPSSIDDYYTYEFSNGELKRKLNKEKYATVESDEYLKSMQQGSSMGLVMKANYIINLPRPAKEVEGKGAKLSEDKKKVTITADLDDFFADPSLLEFKIKY